MRRVVICGVALIVALSGCATSTPSDQSSSAPSEVSNTGLFDLSNRAPDLPILSYSMNGGECSSPCAFQVDVFADGKVVTTAYQNVVFTDELEAATLIAQIETSSRDDIIIGDDDCGREMDGNAPTLRIGNDVIDFCFHEINAENQIVQTVGALRSQIQQQVPLLSYDTLNSLQDSAVPPSLDASNPVDWPTAIEPRSCTPLYAENPDPGAITGALVVEANDEFCNIWEISDDSDPYLCPVPRSWSGEILVRDWFRCPGGG